MKKIDKAQKEQMENNVEYWKKKYKQLNTKCFILLIITLLLLTSTIGMFAYARYVTGIQGNTSAYVAQWSVVVKSEDINGNETNFTDNTTINMATTKVANANVQTGKIAPGDKGQIILNIDATSCETAVTYLVTMDPSNLPTNMKFYSDAGYTTPITMENGIITIRGNLSLIEKNSIVPVVIYWDWPFQTGYTTQEKEDNDVEDTTFEGQTLYANLSVTVSQLNGYGAGQTLASIGRVGEYVNYDATSGSGAGLSITPQASQTGSTTTTTFYSSDITKWRIFDIDSTTGAVTLIAADPTSQTITLSDRTGWKNALTVLNSIGAIYGHGNGAVNAATTGGGRSIQETDISSHSTYNPASYTNNQHKTNGTADGKGYYYYTGNGTENRIEEETYTSGTFIMDNNNEVTALPSNSVTMRQTYYAYPALGYISNPYYNLIFKQSTNTSTNKPEYWVAARCMLVAPDRCGFYVRRVNSGGVNGGFLYNSNGSVNYPSYAVVPMVTLQSNIQVSGMDANGVWILNTNAN